MEEDERARAGGAREPGGRVFLARHGATHANEEGVRLGFMPEPLSMRGRVEARELATRARALSLEAVWTSPLVRARETGVIIARELGVPLRICRELAEMDYGPMEGLYEDEIAQRFPEEKRAWSGEPTVAAPGAEPLATVVHRVIEAIERIRGIELALLITHLTPMRIAWAHYGKRALREAPQFFPAHCVIHRLSERGLEPVELEG